MNKKLENLKENFLLEQENWFLWIPVLFGIGIISYFKLKYEPSVSSLIISSAILFIAYFFIRKNDLSKFIWVCYILIFSGFSLIYIKSHIIVPHTLRYEKKFFKIDAKIDSIQPLSKGTRIVFSNISFKDSHVKYAPKKIRVIFKTNVSEARVGDKVEFSAILSAPSKPLIPGGYDFSRHAYFEELGAVGYAVSNIVILEKNSDGILNSSFLKKTRFNIQEHVLKIAGNSAGGIITSLMIGEYASLDKTLLENLRISGLAHVLSVSGLHLSLIATILFFSIRFILNLSSFLSLQYNIKKIAAIFAIIGSFIYLMLTGAYIAAIRAFIMTSIFLVAIILDRVQLATRSIAIAAIIILAIFPEYLVHPSFQMSFAAVLALVSIYELLVQNGFKISHHNLFYKIIFYFISITVTSIIAGVAISPFIAYHFNQFSKYSVLANILVIPVVSFYIMPLVVVALILYPFGLSSYIIHILKYGIDYFIMVTNYVANLPHSYNLVRKMSDESFSLIILGGLWFLLWQRKWRYYGFIPIIFGTILIFATKQPDIIIEKDSNEFIIIDDKGEAIFSNKIRSELKRESLLKYFGKSEFYSFSNYNSKNIDLKCEDQKCYIKKKNKEILIDYKIYELYKECHGRYDVVFLPNADRKMMECGKNIITNSDLKIQGSHVVFLDDALKVETVLDNLGFRLWNAKK